MVDILIQTGLFGLAALAYVALAGHFWKTRWTVAGFSTSAITTPTPAPTSGPLLDWERLAIAVALALHGGGLVTVVFVAGKMYFSFALALSMVLWLATLLLWIESFRTRLEGLLPALLAVTAVSAALPLLLTRAHEIAPAGLESFRFHLLAAMAAYGLFTLAALQAIFMRMAERKLHQHALTGGMARLPPLLLMETLLFRTVWAAFALLTLALLSGAVYSSEVHGAAFRFDHKTLFGFLSWLIFAGLLVGRHRFGWRGKTATRWLLSGFFALVLAYLGSRFVAEILLGR
jgi:ABC-type uncharacterized transport system permease subunit